MSNHEFVLEWCRLNNRFVAETPDKYFAVVSKVDNRLVGYMGEVHAPGWLYTGSFESAAKARQWCRHIIARDRRAPLTRKPGERGTRVEG